MTTPPPSKIMAEKLHQFDDLRSLFPKRTEPPSHHVRIEELHDAMACCTPALKGRVSLATLMEILQAINGKLDSRASGIRTVVAAELPPVGSWKPSQGSYIPRGMA